MLSIWSQPSGYSFGTVQEQVTVYLDLPLIHPTPDNVKFTIISGELPSGLRISGKQIVGSPFIVSSLTVFTFCIRASNGVDFADRTFKISVNGFNPPQFITPAGELAIGPSQQLYALDSSYVSFQIEASGLNSVAFSPLKYFIASGDGALPPGLSMSDTGLISGFVQPTVSLSTDNNVTTTAPTDGFDTYEYDDVFFDYNKPAITPVVLNANYQFRVTITDGVAYAQRTFRIFVIGTGDFRADSTIQYGVAGSFTADSTYIRKPVWITNNYLGLFRANNYLTVPIALYDRAHVMFRLEATNMEVYSVSTRLSNTQGSLTLIVSSSHAITSGQTFTLRDYVDGASARVYTIAGVDQLETGVYLLSLTDPLGISIPNNAPFLIGSNEVTSLSSQIFINELNSRLVLVTNVNGTIKLGQYFTLDNYVTGASEDLYQINRIIDLGRGVFLLGIETPLAIAIPNSTPIYIGSLSILPTGTNFDVNTGEIYGPIPYQQSVLKTFNFTITATRLDPVNIKESISSSRSFKIDILGDTSSEVVWKTEPNLGTIPADFVCTLNVEAASSVPGAVVTYSLSEDSGPLPPGLTLNGDGEIIGVPNQFYDPESGSLGIIRFTDIVDGELAYPTYDNGATTFDKEYKFTVVAGDQFGYSTVKRTFTIALTTPNTTLYSNITAQPYLVPSQRTLWQSFIGDATVFPPEHIYRGVDPNFGLQRNLKMLVFAGIEKTTAAAYVGAMGLGHKRKRFQFGELLSAQAIDPVTNTVVYEAVYIKMIDPSENGRLHLPQEITVNIGQSSQSITVDEDTNIWSRSISDLSVDAPDATRPSMLITADSTGYQVSNPNTTKYYPNSISNWQERLSTVGLTERNYLPLWMRSIQTGSKEQLGYVLAVPICFCKAGSASTIIANIKRNGFKFNALDYTVDRFTISSVTGYSNDKYLVFRNDRITV